MLLTGSEKKEKRLEFTVVSDAKEFDDAVTKTYLKEKKDIVIRGFRKGKVPLAIIESMYGPDVFYQGALDELVQDAFDAGIEQGQINMIGVPALVNADVTPERCASYTFSVELYPEVKLGQYKEIEVTDPGFKVTADDVNTEIEAVRKQNARLISVDDRPAQMGDTCNIDFEGFLDKEKTDAFDGGKGENYDLELGSNSFVPGFEEQLVGMSVGEEKDIDIKFPDEYVDELAGKDVVFHVTVNEIKFSELPELDDEFAKDVSEFDTLKEYKDSVKKNISERKEQQNKATLRNEAIMKAIDNMEVEVPETMIRAHIDAIIRNFASNYGISDPQISTETLASMLGIDEQTMNNAIRPSAETEAKTEILVGAVIKAENIEGTEEELNEYMTRMSEAVGATVDELKNYFGMDYITDEFKKEKALNLIADSAIVKKAAKKTTAKKASSKKTEDNKEEAVEEKKEAEPEAVVEKKPAAKRTSKKKTAETTETKEE